MKVLSSYNIKGGVGKTSTAVNIAFVAAAEGMRTVLWDLDPQGASTFFFRVKPRLKGGAESLFARPSKLEAAIKGTDHPDLDLVPADFSCRHMDLIFDSAKRRKHELQRLVRRLEGDYDLLVMDCPPTVSLVSDNVFRASDALMVPVIPTPLSLRSFAQLVEHLRSGSGDRPCMLPFFSMVDRRRRLHRDLVDRMTAELPEILRTAIPYATQVEQMATRRRPVPYYAPGSPIAAAYRALWQEIRERL